MSHGKAIKRLAAVWPREEFPDLTVVEYASALAGHDEDVVSRAIENLRRTSKFRPSISEILREIAELELDLPTVEEAWRIAERGRLRFAPEPVQEAVDFVGGRWAILHGDNIPVIRAQFRDAYKNLREQAIRNRIAPRPALAPGRFEEIGPTMLALPESRTVPAPPVTARWLRRAQGQAVGPPTEAEKEDAIRVLEDGPPLEGDPPPIYVEAERILEEAGR